MKKASIFYYSASGNTKRVAEWIYEDLVKRGYKTESFKIPEIKGGVSEKLNEADIIFIGTPTYMWHTPKTVNDFLNSSIILEGKPVGLFVTFGGITVGSNLSAMSRIIKKKGGKIAGALQLEAEHAMMFKGGRPLAAGKPDNDSIPSINKFVDLCLERAFSDDSGLKKIPGIMKYFSFLSPPSIAKHIVPQLKFKKEKCSMCGDCVKNCPTGNISITDELIVHGNNCLLCYNCVRACKTGATDANLLAAEGALRLISHLPEKSSAVY